MMAEEWPIGAAPAELRGCVCARRQARDRLSTVRVDFFLSPAERLTEQERALMTAMLHCLIGDIADEVRAPLCRAALRSRERRRQSGGWVEML